MTTSECHPAEVNTLALELTQYFAYDATTLIVQSSLSSLLFGETLCSMPALYSQFRTL